jgi:hypothetical protein
MDIDKPDLMIRIPKLVNLEKYKDDPRPTVDIEMALSPTTPSPRNMSRRDKLYFKLKKNISRTMSKTNILYNIYNELIKYSDVPYSVRQHFHPLHVLSDKWWNLTHCYMYFYQDVCSVISQFI